MPRETVHVLLIDDNDVDVEGVRRAFRKHRFAAPLIVARDGHEGLELLREGRVPRPHVVLLDLNMPGMGGLEFLARLRADPATRDTVVFVQTTSKRDEDVVASHRQNVAGYFVKSELGVGLAKLVELLRAYLRVVTLPVGGA